MYSYAFVCLTKLNIEAKFIQYNYLVIDNNDNAPTIANYQKANGNGACANIHTWLKMN